MTESPWTKPDPQPGDFDADLAMLGPDDVEVVEAGSETKVAIVIRLENEDAERLEQLATERGQDPADVVSSLLRNA